MVCWVQFVASLVVSRCMNGRLGPVGQVWLNGWLDRWLSDWFFELMVRG